MHLEAAGLGEKDLPCSQSSMATSTTMQERERGKGKIVSTSHHQLVSTGAAESILVNSYSN